MLRDKKTKYRPLNVRPLAALCLLTLTACSSDTPLSDNGTDKQGKTPIELTVGLTGEGSAATRTVVTTDGLYGQNAQPFEATTNIYMVMRSDEKGGSGEKYISTMGVTGTATTSTNPVTFTGSYKRYWEDAHARNSLLSVYAACVPGSTASITIGSESTYTGNTWGTASLPTTIAWPLSGSVASQDATFISSQDLCFSNNVSNLTGNTPADNRIGFLESKKFDSKTMYFYHALTKITFKISRGDGFGTDDSFAFTNTGENIVLQGFNTSGTFDIVTGEFTASTITATTDINQMANTKATGDTEAHVLSALLVPGTNLNDASDADAIHFTLEGNKYSLTKKALTEAKISGTSTELKDAKLTDNSTTALQVVEEQLLMRPGVHYIFTLSVGKTGISNLTAAVVPWEEVKANADASNARITLSLLDNTTHKTGEADFDLYRSAQLSDGDAINDDFAGYAWEKGYTADGNKATLTETSSGSGVYSAASGGTTWYWPNNKTFYHLRAVMPTATDVTTDATNGDYLTLTGGTTLSDICWGAPFKALEAGGKLTYDFVSKGFDGTGGTDAHQIYKAIGPTSSTINLELFHMMSDVTIKLKTKWTDGETPVLASDGVDLDGATLELTQISPNGKVRMGNGLVEPYGTKGTVNGTVTNDATDSKIKTWQYFFVPQKLFGTNDDATTDDVVLTITTSDGNKYIVDMKTIVAATAGNALLNCHTQGNAITAWYPNHTYVYTFTLKKTGISISATLADWESVTAGDDNVQIQ